MRIIAHNASPILGGGEIWLGRLLCGLQTRGHDVMALCRNADVAGHLSATGAPSGTFRLGGDLALHDALRFAFAMHRRKPDALLLTTFQKVWLGGIGARIGHVPRVVARVANSNLRTRHITRRTALRRWIDAIVVNADALRDTLFNDVPDLAHDRVVTICDGVPSPALTKPAGAFRRELALAGGEHLIGCIGRLTRQKRIDRLLESLALLPTSVRCVVAGDGPLRTQLQSHAFRLGIANRVHFLGFRGDIADVMVALDVLVVSSDYEGMANSMLEALAAGTPIVSTDVTGAREALRGFRDGSTPGTVVSFNPTEIANAVQYYLDNPGYRAEASAAARRRYRDCFTFERMLDSWESLLRTRDTSQGTLK